MDTSLGDISMLANSLVNKVTLSSNESEDEGGS